jgi:hypothetical protein
MKTIRILGLAVAVAAVGLLLSMPHASAQPAPSTTYTGTHSGGGEVDFDVSAGGDEVLNLTFTDIPCDGGTHNFFTWPPSETISIVDDEFDATLPPLATRVTGLFPTEGSANGTFKMVIPADPPQVPGCESPELTWTATTAPPAVGGIAVLPDVSDSSVPNYIPLAGLAAGALVAIAAGAWHARRRQPR